jgi:hypothetical protein
MQDPALFRRDSMTARRGRVCARDVLRFSILASLAAALTFGMSIADAGARDRGKNSWGGGGGSNKFEDAMRAMQAQMVRQQEAMREAQKAAEREAAQRQAEMEREMRRDQERAQRDAERQTQRAQQEAQRAQEEARRQAAAAEQRRQREPGSRDDRNRWDDTPDVARNPGKPDDQSGEDSAADLGLSDAERRTREVERAQQRLAQEAAKVRERQRRRDADLAKRNRDRKNEQPVADDKSKDPVKDTAPDRLEARDASPDAPGRARLPGAVQRQWSKSDPKSDEKGTPGKPPAPKSGPVETAKSDPVTKDKTLAATTPPAPVVYPGKEQGAEMPPELYAKAREEEFVVPALTPAEVAKAQERGFTVSPATSVGEGGTKMQRLRAGGYRGNEAERELHKALPFVSVTPNYPYSIFIGSLGEADSASGGPADRRKVSPASAEPCPNNTCFGGQLINWNRALVACAKSTKIGIIDTSFDTAHPAFKGIKATSRAFLDGQEPSPYDWHGTAVLSVLAGNPSTSTPGLVPDATFLLATTFRSDAAGNASTDTLRLLAALAWLEESGADIINLSFAGPQDPAVARAITRMSKKGIVFVAAAGNMGPNAAPSYPAAYPEVIAVTAVNRKSDNYRSANRGPYIDVSAPGVDILTALPKARQGYRTGTSFAVPFVTAILSARQGVSLHAAKRQLLAQIATRDLGPPGRDPIYGAGLALAPKQCAGSAEAVVSAPASPAWVSQTTFVKAGAFGR